MNNNQELLLLIGLSSHLKGYNYIIMSLSDIDTLNITDIYIKLSQKYQTTPCAIERNIRSAIEYCYSYGNTNILNTICIPRYNQSRPSNKQFIKALNSYLCYNNYGDLWKKENTKISLHQN